MHLEKLPLSFDLYEKYQVSLGYEAFLISILNATFEEMDQYEQDLMLRNEKVFYSEMTAANNGKYNGIIVVGIARAYSGFKN
jgi:hypothetical protein